jgi:predicted acylesterase/phospholipase RssA
MFRSIALGGGGVRGGLHIGGLRALAERQPLVFPEGIYGCSIGSIVATCIAFGLNVDQLESILEKEFVLSRFIPPVTLSSLMSFQSKKGMFSMDMLEQTILEGFDRFGIDLRGKVIADAPQKLWIVAANLTQKKTMLLTGQVPLMAAIKASCCIPGVYQPQILFNNVYLDGGVKCDCIVSVVPRETLVFHIGYAQGPLLPSTLEAMGISEFFNNVYANVREGLRPQYPNVLNFEETKLGPLSDVTAAEKRYMLDLGYEQASRFFAKLGYKKLVELVGGDALSKVDNAV